MSDGAGSNIRPIALLFLLRQRGGEEVGSPGDGGKREGFRRLRSGWSRKWRLISGSKSLNVQRERRTEAAAD